MKIEQTERAVATENSEPSSLNLNSITSDQGNRSGYSGESTSAGAANALPDLTLTDQHNSGNKPEYTFDLDRPGGKFGGGKKPWLDGGKKDEFDGGKKPRLDGGKKDEFDGGKKPGLDGGKKDEFDGGKKDKLDPDEPDCIKPAPDDKERFLKKEKEAELIRLKKEKAAASGKTETSLSDIESE